MRQHSSPRERVPTSPPSANFPSLTIHDGGERRVGAKAASGVPLHAVEQQGRICGEQHAVHNDHRHRVEPRDGPGGRAAIRRKHHEGKRRDVVKIVGEGGDAGGIIDRRVFGEENGGRVQVGGVHLVYLDVSGVGGGGGVGEEGTPTGWCKANG